jgi:hypothetical protein
VVPAVREARAKWTRHLSDASGVSPRRKVAASDVSAGAGGGRYWGQTLGPAIRGPPCSSHGLTWTRHGPAPPGR